MNTMNVPGFTAEASLYKTKKRYQDAGSFPRHDKGIFPAQAGEPVDVVDIGELGSLDVEWPRIYGTVVGERMEDRFGACLIGCRRAGGTRDVCRRSCCQALTGFGSCYIA
jgi:hypothetical protein